MIVSIDDKFLNLALVRTVEFDGQWTRIYFGNSAHDAMKFEGDYTAAIVAATGGTKLEAVK